MTSRLRELIQQLGEAIHESVVESDQIASVVQDIRKHGFDVLLMLEATIGLNEVGEKGSEKLTSGEEETADGTFTQGDLHFLKSLRISVEGETENSLRIPIRSNPSSALPIVRDEDAACGLQLAATDGTQLRATSARVPWIPCLLGLRPEASESKHRRARLGMKRSAYDGRSHRAGGGDG